jgi:hypothetical protein
LRLTSFENVGGVARRDVTEVDGRIHGAQASFPHSQRTDMSSTKVIAIVLIIAGVLGLVYGKFSYTKETHDAKVGPIEFSVKDKETVNVPVWAGVGAIVIGAGLLLTGRRT